MKKIILSAATLFSVAVASAQQGTVNDYNFGDFKVHIYTSAEAMHDVSILVEGENGLVVLEPQSFYKSIEDFNAYAEKLGKPIEKIVANYHAGGLAECDLKKVVMVEPMVEFMKSDMAQGMMNKFAGAFQGAMDTRSVKIKKTIPAVGTQKWAGVEFDFVSGASSDFPASSVNIGDKVYYTHFAPNKAHLSPLQLNSREAVDATIADLIQAKESGCELFVGSHGGVASMDDVEFLISYLERVKVLLAECEDSDTFGQRLISGYPHLEGYLNVRGVAQNLYPNEKKCEEKEILKGRMQDYLNMISTQDMNIAKGLWADKKSISLIGARSHYFGFDEIMNFVVNAFSDIPKLEMSSTSEVVNIAGNMGYVQLYWLWVETDANGAKGIERGRETLIFEKIDEEWRLVHVHYSHMPQ